MSLSRIRAVFGAELSYNSRRIIFLIWAVILVLLSYGLSHGNVRIQSGDSTVGGTKAYITSEFALAQQFTILTLLTYGFFAAVVAGMAVVRDDESKVSELLHSTSLRPGEYIWGKFLACLASFGAILAIHVLALIVCNHVLPAGEAKEFRGAFVLSNYVKPALLFAAPTLILIAGLAFATGERTRRPILVYFLPVALLLICVFFLWDWSPSWLNPRIDRALMLIDPGGFRWLNETWLKVDRGVAFYNHKPIPLDWTIISNRLIVISIGFGAVALSHVRLAATLRGTSKRAERMWKASQAENPAEKEITSIAELPQPLSAFGMATKKPGFLAAAWAVARVELAELRSSPGLYLFVPLLVLEALGPNLIAVGAFDTPLLLTSGTYAVRTMNPLTTMICLLLMFYTVESLLRDRHTRLAAISQSAPVRTGSLLLGKVIANSLVGLIIVAAMFLTGAVWLLVQRKVPLELSPFLLTWGLLLVPTIILWTTFVMAVLAITGNRYATYAVGLAVVFFTGYRQVIGKINWVGNWPLWSAVRWSDISILELDRSALILSRVMALGLAVLFVVLTVRFFPRREFDAIRILHRFRLRPLLISTLKLLPFALVPLIAGSVLWARVDYGFEGEAAKKMQKDYWRKNIATYKDWPLPDISNVDVAVDLDPARSFIRVQGSYDLQNNEAAPLAQIPLTAGLHWSKLTWTLDGKPYTPENREHLYIFTPRERLKTGAKTQIGFRFEGTFPEGITKRGGGTNEFVMPSGVVLTSFSPSFAPVVGFLDGVGIDEDNKSESKVYPDDFYKGQTNGAFGSRRPFTARVKITGPADFTLNSIGVLESEDVKDGRRTVVWKSDQPVNFFNVVAGRWKVRRGQGTAVYYHPTHAYNVAEMVEGLDAARRYYSEWFMPFPWKELKLSEFAALADYAQGFPTDITFSESIGFLTESDAKTNVAFMVTAHESAHQWWGNMIMPGKGPGGNLLSEGTSHFSTMLLFEQVKGLHGRIEFAKNIEDRYSKQRRSDSERPMVKIDGSHDGDQTVTYDKAGWVFWMLLNHMGRERAMQGIKAFFATYRENPDHPVLQDFLAVMRPYAKDPAAFDAFTKQWFFQVVVPEYRVSDPKRIEDGKTWKITAKLENIGTGTMPVELAATQGERFDKNGKPNADYRDARSTVTLGAGESKEVEIHADFMPEAVIVDPDAKVLQLRRKAAVVKL
jgi:ABC-type transport system involved in multi-copper enzyme maturation permease subunit